MSEIDVSSGSRLGWHTFAVRPEPGRKFIALYSDGSGAAMFFAFDGGVIDSDGDEYYDWNPDDHQYDRWAYLPDRLEFWCEIRSEDPVCLRSPPQAAEARNAP